MRLRAFLGLLLWAIALVQPAYAQLSGGTLYGQISPPLAIGNTSRSLAPWGVLSLTVANKLGQNSLLGIVNNTLAPSTTALPAGISGYGTIEIGSTGDAAFGVYGLGELYASTGVTLGGEFTSRNFSGSSPDINLPPNTGIGTTTAVAIGQNVTCGTAGGTNDCSIGQQITNESGSYSNSAFNTAQYIGVFRQYGQYIAAQTSGNQTSSVILNNGNGINQIIQTTGSQSVNNAVFTVTDAGSNSWFNIRQNGDYYSSGHPMYMGAAAVPTISACGTGSPAVSGHDGAFTVTTGTGTVTTCTINFGKTWQVGTPTCTVSTNSTALTADISAISATAVSFSFSATLTSGKVYAICASG